MDEMLIKMGGERLEKERFFLQSYCHQIHFLSDKNNMLYKKVITFLITYRRERIRDIGQDLTHESFNLAIHFKKSSQTFGVREKKIKLTLVN